MYSKYLIGWHRLRFTGIYFICVKEVDDYNYTRFTLAFKDDAISLKQYVDI